MRRFTADPNESRNIKQPFISTIALDINQNPTNITLMTNIIPNHSSKNLN